MERDLPIRRTKALTSEVRARYAEEGFTDKIALLDSRPRLYSDLYTLDDTAGYFYGSLAPLDGIRPPLRHRTLLQRLLPRPAAAPADPDRIVRTVHQDKMFGIFREYQSWVRIMGGSPPWATSMPRSSRATPEA